MHNKAGKILWAQAIGKRLICAWALLLTWKYKNATWPPSLLMQSHVANEVGMPCIRLLLGCANMIKNNIYMPFTNYNY